MFAPMLYSGILVLPARSHRRPKPSHDTRVMLGNRIEVTRTKGRANALGSLVVLDQNGQARKRR